MPNIDEKAALGWAARAGRTWNTFAARLASQWRHVACAAMAMELADNRPSG